MTPLDTFRDLVRQHGLESLSAKLEARALRSVRLLPDSAPPTPGQTRLGGLPDLPAGVEWPHYRDKPLAFVLQINLTDLQVLFSIPALPAAGRFYFFYDGESFGTREDRGCGRVLFVENTATPLEPREPPGSGMKSSWFGLSKKKVTGAAVYTPCPLRFESVLVLPETSELALDQPLSDEDEDKLSDLIGDLGNGHRILGPAVPIQGEMEWECEVEARQGGWDAVKEWDAARRTSMEEEAARSWRLLLQVDTDDQHSNIMWGDAGCLYFWIRSEDLAARRFENVWTIMQCT